MWHSGITHHLRGRWARQLPLCYALFSGMPGTQSVLYGKSLSTMLRTSVGGNSQLGQWYFWLAALLFVGFAGFWLTRFSKARWDALRCAGQSCDGPRWAALGLAVLRCASGCAWCAAA
jgi:hypothetical protein